MRKRILLVTQDEIKKNSIIEENVDSKVLSKLIKNVQEIKLQPILGKELYNEILDQIYSANTISDYTVGVTYQTLIEDYIQPYLINQVVADFIVVNNFKIGNKGIIKLNDDSVTTVSSDELKYSKSYYDNQIATFKQSLIDYLIENKFVTDANTIDTDTISPSVGWYLDSQIAPKTAAPSTGSPTGEALILTGDSFNHYLYYTKADVDRLIKQKVDNDTHVTSATFKDNVLSINDNSGHTFNILINDFSGLTVNGIVEADEFIGNGSGLTGLTKSQVGLSNVDNTSDANKPVSNAQQQALNLKVDISAYTANNIAVNEAINKKVDNTTFNNFVTSTNTNLSTKVDYSAYTTNNTTINSKIDNVQSEIEGIQSDVNAVTNALDNKVDTSAYTSTITGLNSALNSKVDISAYTANNLAVKAKIDSKVDESGFTQTVSNIESEIGEKLDITAFTANVIQVNDELSNKVDLSAYTAGNASIQSEFQDLQSEVDTKVDKQLGKGLSSNDFSDAEKHKLDSLSLTDNDTFSTGATFSANTLVITDNAGNTLSTTIDNFSGLTVNGNIIGNGSKLSGLTKSQVGLNLADNTSDADKPVSNAQQSALDLKTDYSAYTANNTTLNTKIDSKVANTTFNNFVTSTNSSLLSKVDYSAYTTNNTVISSKIDSKVDLSAFTANNISIENEINNLQSEVDSLQSEVDTKVDKVPGKSLSSNDLTDALLTKLTGLTNDTNTRVTGVTFNHNVLSIEDNAGNTYSALIDNFSGLTVNGNIIGNGSKLSGLTKSQVGLSNVENTSDANKPVSIAQQYELDKKVDKISGKGLSENDLTDELLSKLQTLTDSYITGATWSADTLTLVTNQNFKIKTKIERFDMLDLGTDSNGNSRKMDADNIFLDGDILSGGTY